MRTLLAFLMWAGAATAQVETTSGNHKARFEEPTNRYGHGIMGDLPEWGRLCLVNAGQVACVTLPETSVFEDIAPRLADMDGDGWPEAVVVESSTTGGAALVVYQMVKGKLNKIATPEIGRRNRWLAPVGIGDLDGDGFVEVAYVDRPHLAKTLRVWRFRDGHLHEVVAASGVTSHRIGEEFITGGLRDCDDGPEMIVVDAGWQNVMAIRLIQDRLEARNLSPFSRAAVARAMDCR